MNTFLLVLKIAGLVLLVLLGLFCFLVLIFLFFPVRYRVWGSFHDKKLKMKARLFLLLHLAGLYIDINESSNTMYLRIVGFKKNLEERDNPEKFEDTIKNTGRSVITSVSDPTAEHDLQMLSLNETAHTQTAEGEPEHKTRRFEIWQKIKQRLKQFKRFFKKLKYNIMHFHEKAEEIRQILQAEDNRAAFHKLKENLFSLLKHISPEKSKLDFKFSAGLPDITGKLLGVLALFPIGYKNNWNILPDFVSEEAYLETDFDFRGHLYGIQILVLLLGIVLDKNCQKLYNKIMTTK